METKTKGYVSACEFLPQKFASVLKLLPLNIQAKTEEIRLRAGGGLAVVFGGKTYFLTKTSELYLTPQQDSVLVAAADLLEVARLICNNSVYSHLDEILNGYITMPFGNRAGVCGVFRQGKFCDITSVNIRISHQIIGVAKNLTQNYSGGSVLICGPPGSGKTTFLRDFVRSLSNGENGKSYRVSVIDTRGEIAAATCGVPQNEVGFNTDVISGRPKPEGIEVALRSMSPEVIAFDEIGTEKELLGVMQSINTGVFIVTTAHIGSVAELKKRGVTKKLIESGVINKVVFLKKVGEPPLILEGEICG